MTVSSFTIGITGHRQLPPEHIPALEMKISAFYQDIKVTHSAENIFVLSSLAEGADMLCAKLALDAGLGLIVPLPMNALDYRKDFSKSAAAVFDHLLSLADQVFVVSPTETIPQNLQRGFYYRQAGIYVANHCDTLLTIWDGIERDTPDGAGTWETVKLARAVSKPIYFLTV